jgi:MFS family permease
MFAMVWVTMPALIGPLIGPPLGGFITTYFSWHWIFLINVPIGIAGIILATLFIENVRAETPDPFDPKGAVLAGIGIAGLVFGGSVLGLNFLPLPATIALLIVGASAAFAYVQHARRVPVPILDLRLLKLPTLRAAVVGGFVYRSGIGAMPFLLPLTLQLGFNMTAFQAGLITVANVVGALGMKMIIPRVLQHFGFRVALMFNAVVSSCLVALCATFAPGVPLIWMLAVLAIGGFFRSLQYTSLNTIAYADVDHARMSRATSLVAVGQQLSISVGVAIGAALVETTLRLRGHDTITAADFQPAWITISAIGALSSLLFWRMPADAGAVVARRSIGTDQGPTDTTDQKQG